MSEHHTSPLRPEADDLLQVSSQNRSPPPLPCLIHRQPTRSHRDRQRSPIPSPSLPTSLASLPHHKPNSQNQQPPPLVPSSSSSSSSPTDQLLRRLPPPSRQQNKRPGRRRTKRKSPSGVDRARKDAHAPRRKGRGGRSVGRVNARSRPPRDRGETSRGRIPVVRVRALARASGRQCRGGA